MAIFNAAPMNTLKAYEMTLVDRAIINFAKIQSPTKSDLNFVRVQSQVQNGIDAYRLGVTQMTKEQLEEESHSSSRMAKHMRHSSDERLSGCDCHAMVSGKHALAAPMRAIMAWCLMRIDDPRNGCWLPRSYDHLSQVPRWLKQAVPHQGLHNPVYYQWLEGFINTDSIDGLEDLTQVLRQIRIRLQAGALRPDAWPKRTRKV